MKTQKSDKKQFVEMTPAQAAAINGGRRGRGADDGPGHVRHGVGEHGPNHT
jgi:hypothetical protein